MSSMLFMGRTSQVMHVAHVLRNLLSCLLLKSDCEGLWCPGVAAQTSHIQDASNCTLTRNDKLRRADEVICSADEPVVQRVKDITGAPRASLSFNEVYLSKRHDNGCFDRHAYGCKRGNKRLRSAACQATI